MRWKPKQNTSVWHWRFARWPVRMDDGTWVWREHYRARYVDVGHIDFEFKWQRHLTEEEDW